MRKNYLKIILIFFITEHFVGINFLVNNSYNQNIYNLENQKTIISVNKDFNIELIDIQNYINYVFKGISIDGKQSFYPTVYPKISVIITVYNGEAFLRTALLSIQNQDFKDIEIIMIDDYSQDNSVNLIKELMIKEPRIVLYQNEENRGMLYTKTKGILLSRGKYILLLDEDDIYVQREAFSILYHQAEKNNLDILGFKLIISPPKLRKIKYKRNIFESPIVFQPSLSEKMFMHTSKKGIKLVGGLLTNHFIKRIF